MAQWSTLMPCNREAAGSNLSGVLVFFLKGAHYEVDYSGKKDLLSWTAIHIDFVMCKNIKNKSFLEFYLVYISVFQFFWDKN